MSWRPREYAHLWTGDTCSLQGTFNTDQQSAMGGVFLDNETAAIVLASHGASIGIFNARKTKLIQQFDISKSVSTLPLIKASADGKRLVVDMGHVTVWDPTNGTLIADVGNLMRFPEPINQLLINRRLTICDDQKEFFHADSQGNIRTYRLGDGQPSRPVETYPCACPLAVSSNGKWAAAFQCKGPLLIRRADALSVELPDVKDVFVHSGIDPVCSAEFSQDSHWLALYLSRRVVVFDVSGDQPKLAYTIPLGVDRPGWVSFSPDSSVLLCMTTLGDVQCFDTATGQTLYPKQILRRPIVGILPIDGKDDFIIADVLGNVVRWSPVSHRPVLQAHIDPMRSGARFISLTTDPSGHLLYTGFEDFVLLDSETLKPLQHIHRPIPQATQASVAHTSDLAFIAQRVTRNTMEIWDARAGKMRAVLSNLPPNAGGALLLRSDPPRLLMVVGEFIGTMDIDTQTFTPHLKLPAKTDPLRCVLEASPDEKIIAGVADKQMFFWRFDPANPPVTPTEPIAVIPNTQRGTPGMMAGCPLVLVPQINGIALLDSESGKIVGHWTGWLTDPAGAAFCPGQPYILTHTAIGRISSHAWYEIKMVEDSSSGYVNLTAQGKFDVCGSESAELGYGSIISMLRERQFQKVVDSREKQNGELLATEDRYRALIAKLNSPDKHEREKIHRELEQAGAAAYPTLHRVLRFEPAGERRERIQSLIDHVVDPPDTSAQDLAVTAAQRVRVFRQLNIDIPEPTAPWMGQPGVGPMRWTPPTTRATTRPAMRPTSRPILPADER